MTRVIVAPTVSGVVSSEFNLTRAIAQSISPFSGSYRQQSYDYNYWSGSVTLAPQRRSTAREWQSFLSALEGTTNYFKFGDPAGLEPTGTYTSNSSQKNLQTSQSKNLTGVTLNFDKVQNRITATGSTPFSGMVAGEFITIGGANNSENNGTFKVQIVNFNGSIITLTLDRNLVTENGTSGCTVKQNCKGATALILSADNTTSSGTIKAGDYLALYTTTEPATTLSRPFQYVMVTEDATLEVSSGNDVYHVAIQPPLRTDSFQTAGLTVGFANDASLSNRGLFRLVQNDVNWNSNQNNVYSITFSFTEAIL